MSAPASRHRKALDLAREGKWRKAHEIVQAHSDPLSCLIHAYVHRVEGDLENARYWYGQAGETMPANSLQEELARLYGLLKVKD
jgi:hypothetical protein